MGGELRSSKALEEAIKFIHEGKLGKVYMAKGIVYRKLTFSPDTEKFVNDEEANSCLTRKYGAPYLMLENV